MNERVKQISEAAALIREKHPKISEEAALNLAALIALDKTFGGMSYNLSQIARALTG